MTIVNVSIDPTFFTVGPVRIGWAMLTTALAILAAAEVFMDLGRRVKLPAATLERAIRWIAVGGVLGGRIVVVFRHLSYFRAVPREIFAIWHGELALDGVILGALVGLLSMLGIARRERSAGWRLLDVAAPAALIGLAIGEVGPFLTGAGAGRPTNDGWGVVYWHPDALAPPRLLGVPTEPAPLYLIGVTILLLGLLWTIRARLAEPGSRALLVGLGFAVGQFIVARTQAAAATSELTAAQLGALAIASLTVVAYMTRRHASGRDTSSGYEESRDPLNWPARQ